MKKILLSMIAVLAMSMNAVAQNIADLVGNYKGDLYISLGAPINEETQALPDQSIKIEAGAGQSINFALYNFSFGETPLGDIVLNNVGVKSENGVTKFNDEKPVDLSFLGGAILATAKINPATSEIKGDNITANLDVFWKNGEALVPIYVRFIGKKEAQVPSFDIQQLVGNYNGDLYISLGAPISGETQALPNQSIKIEAGAGQTINFALYNFSFGETPLGDIVLNNVGVKSENGVVKFNDEKPVDLSFLGGAILATAKINPATSEIKGDSITANLDVFWVQSPTEKMPIYVRFIGKKGPALGIENAVNGTAVQSGVYNLSGVRVAEKMSNRLPKGIYIVNGKKTIVK